MRFLNNVGFEYFHFWAFFLYFNFSKKNRKKRLLPHLPFSGNNWVNMVPGQLLYLANLLRAQSFGIHQLLKVVIIGENEEFVFAVLEILMPSFKSLNDS